MHFLATLKLTLKPLYDSSFTFSNLPIICDMELVGEARNADEAVHLCEQLQPDVVLMDLMMVGMNGAEATRVIRKKYPEIQVLILTSFLANDLVQ